MGQSRPKEASLTSPSVQDELLSTISTITPDKYEVLRVLIAACVFDEKTKFEALLIVRQGNIDTAETHNYQNRLTPEQHIVATKPGLQGRHLTR